MIHMATKLSLRQLRLLAGYRQIDVAEKLAVSIQSVTAWENGKFRPSKDKIEELAKLYGVGYQEIIDSLPEGEDDLSELKLEKVLRPSKQQRQIVESLLKQSISSYFKG